jgi:hypothetical protein
VTSVTDVTPALLGRLGVRGVLVDLDDTLIASNAEALGAEAEAWLRRAAARGHRAGDPVERRACSACAGWASASACPPSRSWASPSRSRSARPGRARHAA